MPDLLLELYSEEIPARMQSRASEDIRRLVTDGLVERGLTYGHAAAFATPRRLTLALTDLAERSADLVEERKGPRIGAPDAALQGFLRSTGLTKDRLEVRGDRKAEVWFAVTNRPGRPAKEIVAETVEAVVRAFPWPKSMRWGAGTLRWVRPLHSILCILSDGSGAEIVPFRIDGIASGEEARGHRFMAPDSFKVASYEDYASKLLAAKVLLDPEARSGRILHDATQLAFAQGLEIVEDRGLLMEIAGLVEWPQTLIRRIDARFLDLPPEVLRTSMREHQKFLSVREPSTGRIVAYIVVANRETADDGATILAGNAKVLVARLSDAKFFWENDRRVPLEEMAGKLDTVTFHNRLGTQGARVARIAEMARRIAPAVGADPDLAERAARLAKADLASEMVYEFPELQGVMGKYYALAAGEDSAVAAAIAEHYSPLGPSDKVPTAPVSVAVALADKLDVLTAFWAIDEKPTGSKDPFALRRAALGVVRIVLENGLRIELRSFFVQHATNFASNDDGTLLADSLLSFMADRLKVHLRDDGLRHDIIDAAFELGGQDDLVVLVARVRALRAFLSSDAGRDTLAGYRRAANILAAEEKRDGVEYSLDPHPGLADTDAEKSLFSALDAAEAEIGAALEVDDFAAAMSSLSTLRTPIDSFFETTVVNVDALMVRRNRLCLLHRIRSVMNRVAVFSAVEGG